VEKRKKERQKLVAKKRNLESLATDAKQRAEDFERRVSVWQHVLTLKCVLIDAVLYLC